jgi:SAM-dependent methyltransferase
MGLDAYRRASLEVWNAMAAGWAGERELISRAAEPLARWLVERLAPAPGDTVLELAAGAGEVGFLVAERVGVHGRVLSTDFAPAMVEAARRVGAMLDVRNIEYQVMNAERMDLTTASVDGVVCRWGYMLMGDPAAALAETRRVLKPGGRLASVVIGDPERNPWATVPARLLVERGAMTPPTAGAPGLFALSDPTRIGTIVSEAGFDTCEIDDLPHTWRFDDADAYWRFLTQIAGAIAMVLAKLPDDERARVRSAIDERMQPYRKADGYEVPAFGLGFVAH